MTAADHLAAPFAFLGRAGSNRPPTFLDRQDDRTFAAALADAAKRGTVSAAERDALCAYAQRQFAAAHPLAYSGEPFHSALSPDAPVRVMHTITQDEARAVTAAIVAGDFPVEDAEGQYAYAITAEGARHFATMLFGSPDPEYWPVVFGAEAAQEFTRRMGEGTFSGLMTRGAWQEVLREALLAADGRAARRVLCSRVRAELDRQGL